MADEENNNINIEGQDSESVRTVVDIASSAPAEPKVFELRCSSCGIIGELEEYIDEFDCPQCGGKMYPIEASIQPNIHTDTIPIITETVPEPSSLETPTISISKAQILEYRKNIKVAKPVDIGIFSPTSSTKSAPISTSTKSMLAEKSPAAQAAKAAEHRTASNEDMLQTIPDQGDAAHKKSSVATATGIVKPDLVLEKELARIEQQKLEIERQRRERETLEEAKRRQHETDASSDAVHESRHHAHDEHKASVEKTTPIVHSQTESHQHASLPKNNIKLIIIAAVTFFLLLVLLVIAAFMLGRHSAEKQTSALSSCSGKYLTVYVNNAADWRASSPDRTFQL